MNVFQIGGSKNQPSSRNEKVSRSRTKSAAASSTKGEGQAPRDAVSVDRATADRVRVLKQQVLDSPEIRQQKVQQLREQFAQGRLRQRSVFEATAEAILKGQLMLDDLNPSELM